MDGGGQHGDGLWDVYERLTPIGRSPGFLVGIDGVSAYLMMYSCMFRYLKRCLVVIATVSDLDGNIIIVDIIY